MSSLNDLDFAHRMFLVAPLFLAGVGLLVGVPLALLERQQRLQRAAGPARCFCARVEKHTPFDCVNPFDELRSLVARDVLLIFAALFLAAAAVGAAR